MNDGTRTALNWYAGEMVLAGWDLVYCPTCDTDVWVVDATCPSCGGPVAI